MAERLRGEFPPGNCWVVQKMDKTGVIEGELVEVIVLARKEKVYKPTPSPLRGKVIEYIDPTEPVARDDWEVLL